MSQSRSVSRFAAAFVFVVACVIPTTTAGICIWCDPVMSQNFLTCIYRQFLSSEILGTVPISVLDDMENSMIAASSAMKESSDPTKMKMMNGAMAGELSELIKSCPQSSLKDAKAISEDLMDIIGSCYFQASGQPPAGFTRELKKTIDFMILQDEPVYDNPDSSLPEPYPVQTFQSYAAVSGNSANQYPAQSATNSDALSGSSVNQQSAQKFPVAVASSGSNVNQYLIRPSYPFTPVNQQLDVVAGNAYNSGGPSQQNNRPGYVFDSLRQNENTAANGDLGSTEVNAASGSGAASIASGSGAESKTSDVPVVNSASNAYSFNRQQNLFNQNTPPNNFLGPNFVPNYPLAKSMFPGYAVQNPSNLIPDPIKQQEMSALTNALTNAFSINYKNIPFAPQNQNFLLTNTGSATSGNNGIYPMNKELNAGNVFYQGAAAANSAAVAQQLPNNYDPGNNYNQPPINSVLASSAAALTTANENYPNAAKPGINEFYPYNNQNYPGNNFNEDIVVNSEAISSTNTFNEQQLPNIPDPDNNYNQPPVVLAEASAIASDENRNNPVVISEAPKPVPSTSDLRDNNMQVNRSSSDKDSSQSNTSPKTTKKKIPKSKPKRGGNKKVKTVSNNNTLNQPNSPSSSDDEIARAMKFSESIFVELSESADFNRTFSADITNDKACFILFDVIIGALNYCGYSQYSDEMANACIIAIKLLPDNCPAAKYGEAIAKYLMGQFYKKKLITDSGDSQGKDIATAILSLLKGLSPSESAPLAADTSKQSSSDAASKSLPTPASKTPIKSSNNDSNASGNKKSRATKNFYKTLYRQLQSSFYFSYVFRKDVPISDAILFGPDLLKSCLTVDYGDSIANEVANECGERLKSVSSKLFDFAKVIAGTIVDVFSYYNIISLNTSSGQVLNIVSKIDKYLKQLLTDVQRQQNVHSTTSETSTSATQGDSQNTRSPNPQQSNNNNPSSDYQYQQSNYEYYKNNNNNNNDNNNPYNDDCNDGGDYFNTETPDDNQNNKEYPDQEVKDYGAGGSQSQSSTASSAYAAAGKQNTKNASTDKKMKRIKGKKKTTSGKNKSSENSIEDEQILQTSQTQTSTDSNSSNNNESPITNVPNQELQPPKQKFSNSKDRIKFLMKHVLSSISNGKFNYKVFSKIISSLVKSMQKLGPGINPQYALFSILIETLIACTQLLIQVPSKYFDPTNGSMDNKVVSSFKALTTFISNSSDQDSKNRTLGNKNNLAQKQSIFPVTNNPDTQQMNKIISEIPPANTVQPQQNAANMPPQASLTVLAIQPNTAQPQGISSPDQEINQANALKGSPVVSQGSQILSPTLSQGFDYQEPNQIGSIRQGSFGSQSFASVGSQGNWQGNQNKGNLGSSSQQMNQGNWNSASQANQDIWNSAPQAIQENWNGAPQQTNQQNFDSTPQANQGSLNPQLTNQANWNSDMQANQGNWNSVLRQTNEQNLVSGPQERNQLNWNSAQPENQGTWNFDPQQVRQSTWNTAPQQANQGNWNSAPQQANQDNWNSVPQQTNQGNKNYAPLLANPGVGNGN